MPLAPPKYPPKMGMAHGAAPAAAGEICAWRDEERRKKLPQANTPVANRTRNGTSRSKKLSGVASSSKAPQTPPIRLTTARIRKLRPSAPDTWRRPVNPVATWPGNNAIVEVTLAALAPMPNSRRAGKVMKEPPPASAFWAPATRAATINNR